MVVRANIADMPTGMICSRVRAIAAMMTLNADMENTIDAATRINASGEWPSDRSYRRRGRRASRMSSCSVPMTKRASSLPPSTAVGEIGAMPSRALVPQISSSRMPKQTLKIMLISTNVIARPGMFCSSEVNSRRSPVRLRSSIFSSSS